MVYLRQFVASTAEMLNEHLERGFLETGRRKKMEGKELVEKLLRGSENIDRMRKEIKSVVLMVLGFVKNNWSTGETYVSGGCKWIVGRDCDNAMQIECWVDPHPSFVGPAYTTSGNLPILLRNVQAVYGGLPVLIEGIAKTFPALKKLWQPLLDAADAARK